MIKKSKKIVLRGREVAYCLRTSRRAKYLRVAIGAGGAVAVTRPFFVSEAAVENFLGKRCSWVLNNIARMENRCGLLSQGTRADFLRFAPLTRDLILEKIAKFNRNGNFCVNQLTIRDQKTRWGSCSRLGNLNFNYRVALLPDCLIDYIVAHELCHLRELNHSSRFWGLVAKLLPNYAALRRELKNY